MKPIVVIEINGRLVNMNNMNKKIDVTIIIPCRNEEKYIEGTIKSIINFKTNYNYEVLFIDGMSTDKTREMIKSYSNEKVKLILNKNKTVPYALNLGIKKAKGAVIMRLDAHASYPHDYVQKLVDKLYTSKADNVGGIWFTDVINKNKKSISIVKVLSDSIGVGNSLFRTGAQKETEVDTVPFGCYKKDIFAKVGLFDVLLTRNQDIELNKRIKQSGGKIILVPSVHCTYYARETFKELAKNNFQNGLWNLLTVYYTKSFRSLSPRHFIPLIFLLSLLIPIFLSFININFILISVVIFVLYFVVILYRSIKLNDSNTSFFNLLWAFITLHFSYGCGSIMGILKVIGLQIKVDKIKVIKYL